MKWRGVTLAWSGLLLAALFIPAVAAAEQFVVLDLTYEATAENTMDSHYEVPPAMGIPGNWRSPVNYAEGTVHLRFEVTKKPSNATTLLNLCFRNPSNYACMPYPPGYTEPGVYQFSAPFSAFWQGDLVDWAMGVDTVMLILKDENEVKVHGDSMFYPYEMRATITVVSPGSTYMPPDLGGGMEPAAGAGGGGGRGAAGAAAMGGRGAAGASGSGGSGGGGAGAAGADSSEGGGGMDASTPIFPVPPDAGSDDEADFFGDDPIGTLPPQPVAARPNKRAPPPGDLEGRSCSVAAPGAERRAGPYEFLGLALFAVAAGVKARARRRSRVR